jgi:hypothetical protein
MYKVCKSQFMPSLVAMLMMFCLIIAEDGVIELNAMD